MRTMKTRRDRQADTATLGRRGKGFLFGIESEYLLLEQATCRPLRRHEMSFTTLNAILESISVQDLPDPRGLPAMPPHRRPMYFYVEGYHTPDPDAAAPELLPKGIEIRTPPCNSIKGTLEYLATLHNRLQVALAQHGLSAAAMSHHPIEDHFEGPQGTRSPDRWRWCMQAMQTYGPDINISLPPALAARLNAADLTAKVNYYAPALAALSLASPIHEGSPWVINGRVGKSLRTFRRSLVGDALRLHPRQQGRLEFKSFEMTHRLADFHAFLLLWLTLLLDDGLTGRGTEQSRIYDLGAVAVDGLAIDHVRERAEEVLDRAEQTLPAWGFDPKALEPFTHRVATKRLPADEILALYEQHQSLNGLMRHLIGLEPEALAPATRPRAGTCRTMQAVAV